MIDKMEYITSLPDVVMLKDAANDASKIFIQLNDTRKAKPEGQLDNYIAFHRDLRYGIYEKDGRYMLVYIPRSSPKKMLFGVLALEVEVTVITEILTDDTDDSPAQKGAITGNTLVSRPEHSETEFLNAVTSFHDSLLEKQSEQLAEEAIKKQGG